MNYLAHIYLSGENIRIQIGNFMGDGVRGKEYLQFHKDIQTGILLHRAIDTFTDTHLIFRKSKHRLVPKFNHFSGIIVDMFYDHFLAKHWEMFHHIPLKDFVQDFYNNLNHHNDEINQKTRNILPYLTKQNWLERYQYITDLQVILKQMDQRFSFPAKMNESVELLYEFYDIFEDEFFKFFRELMIFAEKKKIEIETKVNSL